MMARQKAVGLHAPFGGSPSLSLSLSLSLCVCVCMCMCVSACLQVAEVGQRVKGAEWAEADMPPPVLT